MRYFFVPREQITKDRLHVQGSELHHMLNVLRLKVGDSFFAIDGQGFLYEAVLTSILYSNPPIAIGEIKSRQQVHPPKNHISLFQALLKYEKMDMIIQKATEIGVDDIFPVLCRYTIPKLSPEKLDKKLARWEQITIEASKQSKRAFLPKIHGVISFEQALDRSKGDLRLLLTQTYPDNSLTESIKSILRANLDPKSIDIFIGPEGDFDITEKEKAISSGVRFASLGSNTLRAETACIAALSIVAYEFRL